MPPAYSRPNRRRFFLLGALLLCAAGAVSLAAQTSDPLAGRWKGELNTGGANLRLIVEVSRASDGVYSGHLISVDQGGARIAIDEIALDEEEVRFEIAAIAGSFRGELSEDHQKIAGFWTQGRESPLELQRTEAAEAAAEAAPPKPLPLGAPVDLYVPTPPTPFDAGGRRHLVYELHITNFGPSEIRLRRIEVLSGESLVADLSEGRLNAALGLPARPAAADKRGLPAGLRGVAYLWIELDGEPPASLRHRLTVGADTVTGAEIPVRASAPLVLGPPLEGEWFAGNGPGNQSMHRRGLIAVEGRARIAQRFATDWLQREENGKTFSGDQKDNASYHAYGAEVLAVADATVVAVKDGIPENVPGPRSRAVRITLETIGGNYVVLDLGEDRYALYAHLQPGSLRVEAGDRVARGQVLGLLGNSGNSTEPHLHFHVSDGASPLGAEGMPYVIDAWELLSSDDPGRRRNELPLNNVRVRFPERSSR